MKRMLLAGIAVAVVAGGGACNSPHTYEELPVVEKTEEQKIPVSRLEEMLISRARLRDLGVKSAIQSNDELCRDAGKEIVEEWKRLLFLSVEHYEYVKMFQPEDMDTVSSLVGIARNAVNRLELRYEDLCQ